MKVCLIFLCAVNWIFAAVPGHGASTHLDQLDMISGLAASRRHPDILYAVNDNDGEGIYMINSQDGSVVGVLTIAHGEEYDWEDISVGPCPDYDSCIFVADTGPNTHGKAINTIYRVKEPRYVFTQDVPLSAKYEFTWHEDSSSAMVVDPTGKVFLFSQANGRGSKLYELNPNGWNHVSPVAATPLKDFPTLPSPNLPLGADLSADGKHLLVKTLYHVYEWEVAGGNIAKALDSQPKNLAIRYEHEGESLAWASDLHGFYTIGQGDSEKLNYHSYP